MVLQNSLMTFFSVDRNLADFQIELKHSDSRDSLVFFQQNYFLSEAVCEREQKILVCNSYLLWA